MNILITGSSGMIGTALVKKLDFDKIHTFCCVDIKEPKHHTVETTIHDLRTPFLATTVPAVDLVIHLAANARVRDLIDNPTLALDNISMIHNILEFCRANRVPKFLFASSREIYGNTTKPVNEQYGSHRSIKNLYAASKIAGESYCQSYRACYGIDTKIVRFSNVYGQYDDSDRLIPKAIETLKSGIDFNIYGSGLKELDMLYIDDCVDGIMTVVDSWDKLSFDEYNIANGESVELEYVVNKLKELLESVSKINTLQGVKGEVDMFKADINRMKNEGWSPRTSIDGGLEKSIKNYA